MANVLFAEDNGTIWVAKENHNADGTIKPAVNASPTGTITTTVASAAVVGVGTLFTKECVIGQYLYTSANAIIGRILTITTDTALVLDAVVPASATTQALGVMALATAVTGVAFKIGLGPKNAIKVNTPQGKATFTTSNHKYSGDSLSIDSDTTVNDVIGDVEFTIFDTILGTIAEADPVPSEILFTDLYEASGLGIALSSGGQGYALITREVPTQETVTIQYRLSSPTLTNVNEQKVYTFTNVVANFDLMLEIGQRPKCKFTGKGNYIGNVEDIVYIEDSTVLNQRKLIAPVFAAAGISLVELTEYTTEAVPSIVGTSNVCIEKLSIPNFNAWQYDRQRNSCSDGFSASGADAKFTLTMLEDKAAAAFNPQNALLAERPKLFLFTVRVSNSAANPTAGKRIQYEVKKCQIINVTPTTINKQKGFDVEFQIIGATSKKLY